MSAKIPPGESLHQVLPPSYQPLLLVSVASALAVGLWAPHLFSSPFVPTFLLLFPTVLCLALILWWPEAALPAALFTIPLVNVHFEIGLTNKTLSYDKLLLVAVVGGWALRRMILRRWRLPRDPILSLWVIWLLVQALTVALTRTALASQVWYLCEQIAYALFFLVCLDFLRVQGKVLPAVYAVVASGWVVTILGMLDLLHLKLTGRVLALTYPASIRWLASFSSTLAHPNFYSAFQTLCIPFSMWVFWKSPRKWRWALGLMLVLQVISVILTQSLGGGLGLIVVALIGCWWIGGKQQWRKLGYVLLALGILFSIWVAKARDPQWFGRSVVMRAHILDISRHIFTERLFFGHGLGMFPKLFPEYEQVYGRERLVGDFGNWRSSPRETSAHNWFLRVAVEEGLAGLLTFLGLIGWVMATRWYSLRSFTEAGGSGPSGRPSEEGERRRALRFSRYRLLRVALLASLVGFVVQAFTEELFAHSKIVLIFWALTAVGVTLDTADRLPDDAARAETEGKKR